jgi:cell division protein FtsW (lipid II flippase)
MRDSHPALRYTGWTGSLPPIALALIRIALVLAIAVALVLLVLLVLLTILIVATLLVLLTILVVLTILLMLRIVLLLVALIVLLFLVHGGAPLPEIVRVLRRDGKAGAERKQEILLHPQRVSRLQRFPNIADSSDWTIKDSIASQEARRVF